jgi:hypothetical protein
MDPDEAAERARRGAVARLPPGTPREIALALPRGLASEELIGRFAAILDTAEAETRSLRLGGRSPGLSD